MFAGGVVPGLALEALFCLFYFHSSGKDAVQGVVPHGMPDFEAVVTCLREPQAGFVQEAHAISLACFTSEPITFACGQDAFQGVDAGFHVWENGRYQEKGIAPGVVFAMF